MAPYELIDVPPGEAPQGYTLSPNEAMGISSVTAIFDGSAAAFAFLPTLAFYAPSGELLARQFAEEQHPGEVSEVTFAPFLKRPRSVSENELPSLCGGMDAGPIASGSGPAPTLVLTVARSVPCDALVIVVPCYLSLGTAFTETGAPSGVVDSHGNVFTGGGGVSFAIGAIGQNLGGPPWSRLEGGNTWQHAYAANTLRAGDTITVSFGLNFPAAATVAAMAFAVINVDNVASVQTFGGVGPIVSYANADSFPDVSADPRALDWCVDLAQCNPQNPRPVHFSAGLSLVASYPDKLPYFPTSGQVIGSLGGWGAGLAVLMDRCVLDDDGTYDPGGSWDDDAQMHVGNYQFARFACP